MEIIVKTDQKQQVVDITDLVQDKADSNTKTVNIFVKHTTCAITTADLDPGTDQDILEAIKEMIPKLNYRHPHDPSHVWSHIASTIIGPSVVIPVEGGKLQLGTWQRIVLIELDGPRDRTIIITSDKG